MQQLPAVSNKHSNAQVKFYSTFNGGLNLSVPSESLASNELKEALNLEFSPLTGALRVRGGLVWTARFDREIYNVIPVPGRRGFLVDSVFEGYRPDYFRWNSTWKVDGLYIPHYGIKASAVTWNEYGDLLIASGQRLQHFSDKTMPPKILEISDSPTDCRFVFIREGRVGVVSGTNTLRFSHIGDYLKWDNDPDDESTGQFIEVGYKDGMAINAVVPLSKDLIIFKSPYNEIDKGTIWRLTGEFPNWQLLEVARNTGTFSQDSVQVVGNDVFFLTTSGLATLSSVTSYGEIKTSWPDTKVSSALIDLIDDSAQLWNVPVKQQLWIQPSKNEKKIWVFDYAHGIWTKFEFPGKPIYAAGIDEKLYIFIGKDLYNVHDYYIQDDMKDTGKKIIQAKMKMGTILNSWQTLIKGAFASFELWPECDAKLILNKFKMPFKVGGTQDYIYDPPNDTQYASEDDDPLFPDGSVLTSRRKCIVRDWSIDPEINIQGGGCSVSTVGLEIAEV